MGSRDRVVKGWYGLVWVVKGVTWITAGAPFCQNILAHFQLDFELRATEIQWDERFREL